MPGNQTSSLTELSLKRDSEASVSLSPSGSGEPFPRDAAGKPVIPLETAALYSFASLIRGTEELLLELFSHGLLSGTTHTALGQELCQMAAVRALSDPDDAVLSNHRNHGHFLTYTGNFRGLIEEIMGRQGGVCGGVGGSQHLAYRNFHSSGVQGGMTASAVGQALARKLRGSSGIVVVIVGDGTLGEGLLYESLNMASAWRLPLLFVVENNGIAQTTPTASTMGGSALDRGSAFGLSAWRLDDTAEDFFERTESVIDEVRRTRCPGFLVIDTMRMGPHSKGDDLRDSSEMELIRRRDPLRRLGERLAPGAREAIDACNKRFLGQLADAARRSPEATFARPPATIFTNHPERATSPACSFDSGTGSSVRQALNSALRKLLSEVPEVVLLGEDLHDPYGGAFKVTAGLSTDFPERVISTPISEAGIIGAGIGLALAGRRPIVEVMFADFLALGMDQILNHAVKFPGMFPDGAVPLVIRTPSGGRRGYGPTHSQSTESLMVAVPGLTVVFPSHRHAAGEHRQAAEVRLLHPRILLAGAGQAPVSGGKRVRQEGYNIP